MVVKCLELAILFALSLISDFRTYKIDNRITIFFAAAGLVTNLAANGWKGLLTTLFGMLLPVLLLFWLYLPGMLGAGDIKLFCAVGSIMGPLFITWCIAWSFLAGGVAALVLMLVRKNAGQRLRYLGSYLKTCMLTSSIKKYSDMSDLSGGAKFHFSPAVAIGCVIQLIVTIK